MSPANATTPQHAGLRGTLERTLAALRAGTTPVVGPDELVPFSPQVLEVDPDLRPDSLQRLLEALGPADLPTLSRALAALEADERAWLGFKVVTDPAAALDSEDTEVVGRRGKGMGSADGRPGVFLVLNPTGRRDDAEIVFSRVFSDRDRFQMLDVTRGPRVHCEQYAGLAWRAVPLYRQPRVFLLGAGPVAQELERAAALVDFATVAVDFDASYLDAARFPLSRRVLIPGFDAIPDLGIGPDDYVCVLTRGHMHDPEALVCAIRSGARYVGMLGSAGKNERVFELAERAGVDRAALQATRTPIGLRFGARTPAELAIAIVAELIQVRNEHRKAAAAG
jgi:xanthine dehydrogenase accessory factor